MSDLISAVEDVEAEKHSTLKQVTGLEDKLKISQHYSSYFGEVMRVWGRLKQILGIRVHFGVFFQ